MGNKKEKGNGLADCSANPIHKELEMFDDKLIKKE